MKSKHIERIRAAYYEQSLTPEDSGYDQDDCDMPFITPSPYQLYLRRRNANPRPLPQER